MKKNVVISSHVLLYGAAHALVDYLNLKKTNSVTFISLPFYNQRFFSVKRFRNGKKISSLKFPAPDIGIVNNLFEILFVFSSQIIKEKTDLYVGVDPLNALTGLMLRKIKKTDKVIYYTIDFVPQRFDNKYLNKLFHALEKYCVKKCDEIWNVSPRISEGRAQFLNLNPEIFAQKVVPIGVWPDQKRYKIQRESKAVFAGHILEKQGIQKVIETIPEILRQFPEFKLEIIGGGEYLDFLIKKVKALNLERQVQFEGWVSERTKLKKKLLSSSFAVACYKPEKDKLTNFTYYADPTKIKDYLSCGLPIVLTNVPYNAYEIEKEKCGIVVDYNVKSITNGILEFLKNKKKLESYRKNAESYTKKFYWNNIFDEALKYEK